MAQLKVKQISDFTTAVDSLIAAATTDETASINSLESYDSVQDLSIDALQTGASAADDSINSLESYDSVQDLSIDALQDTDAATAESISSLEDVDTALIASVDSLELATGGNTSALEASVDSLESYDSIQDLSIDSLETLAGANDASIAAILSGADVSLDQFIEIVNFVGSMDTVNDNLLSDFIDVANLSIDSLESYDSVQDLSIDSLEVLDAATGESIASLEDVDTALIASVNSLESYDSVQDLSIDALQAADGVLNSSIDSLESVDSIQNLSIDSLELVDAALSAEFTADTTYIRQGAAPVSITEARFNTPIRLGADDDIAVFVNGLEIHPVGILINSGGEFGGAPASTAEGYTIVGTTITFVGLGYDLEGNDHVHVHGIVA